jgi:hypothetical protein
MRKQLGKLISLEGKHLLGRPVLALREHVENFPLHPAHQAISQT